MLVIRRLLTLLCLAAALAASVGANPAAADDAVGARCTLFAELRPGNEVPPPTSLALGAAVVQVDGATLRFAVAIANLSRETFVAGHIHRAVAGVNGPVVVPLFSSPGVAPRLCFQAGPAAIDPALDAEICGNPAGFYVNDHTTERPGGTASGQLSPI